MPEVESSKMLELLLANLQENRRILGVSRVVPRSRYLSAMGHGHVDLGWRSAFSIAT
jgi:hypothetical protein